MTDHIAFPKPGLRTKSNANCSKYWDSKAGAAWGEWIHLSGDGCLVCGKKNVKLEAHHFIRKANHITRHDPKNGGILCDEHHRGSKECSPHNGAAGFKKFLSDNYPEKSDYILLNKHTTGKANFKEDYKLLRSMIDDYSMN